MYTHDTEIMIKVGHQTFDIDGCDTDCSFYFKLSFIDTFIGVLDL